MICLNSEKNRVKIKNKRNNVLKKKSAYVKHVAQPSVTT